jgi:hypothetical protein
MGRVTYRVVVGTMESDEAIADEWRSRGPSEPNVGDVIPIRGELWRVVDFQRNGTGILAVERVG